LALLLRLEVVVVAVAAAEGEGLAGAARLVEVPPRDGSPASTRLLRELAGVRRLGQVNPPAGVPHPVDLCLSQELLSYGFLLIIKIVSLSINLTYLWPVL